MVDPNVLSYPVPIIMRERGVVCQEKRSQSLDIGRDEVHQARRNLAFGGRARRSPALGGRARRSLALGGRVKWSLALSPRARRSRPPAVRGGGASRRASGEAESSPRGSGEAESSPQPSGEAEPSPSRRGRQSWPTGIGRGGTRTPVVRARSATVLLFVREFLTFDGY